MRKSGWAMVSVCLFVATLTLLCFLLAASGEGIIIKLDANPTTGYQWSYQMQGPGQLRETHSDYQSSSWRIGAGGEQIWRFAPVADGDVTLTFTYARAWDPQPDDLSVTYRYRIEGGKAQPLQ